MTVTKVGDEYWIDVYIRKPGQKPRRIRRRSRVQTRRGSEAYEREVVAFEYSRDTTTSVTLEKFARTHFAAWARANNSPAEYERKEKALRVHLVPKFGAVQLDQITAHDIEKYKIGLLTKPRETNGAARRDAKKPLGAKTVINILSVLGKLLVVARKAGCIRDVPEIEMPKLDDGEFDFFDFAESERLLDGADAGAWRTFFLVAIRTGLRCGELRALTWENVDLERGVVHVRRAATVDGKTKAPKNKRFRDIPLGAHVIAALKEHRHLRGRLVFCRDDGSMLLEHDCKVPLNRACRRAGLRTVGIHVLRHTFASQLAMRGVPLLTIQRLLGHRTITMTLRYAHLAPVVFSDAIAVLDRESGGSGISTVSQDIAMST